MAWAHGIFPGRNNWIMKQTNWIMKQTNWINISPLIAPNKNTQDTLGSLYRALVCLIPPRVAPIECPLHHSYPFSTHTSLSTYCYKWKHSERNVINCLSLRNTSKKRLQRSEGCTPAGPTAIIGSYCQSTSRAGQPSRVRQLGAGRQTHKQRRPKDDYKVVVTTMCNAWQSPRNRVHICCWMLLWRFEEDCMWPRM